LEKLTFFILLILFTSCGNTTYPQGKILYENFCVSCHMPDGTGLKSLIPTLVKADYLLENPLKTACIIRYGIKDTIMVNGPHVGEKDNSMPYQDFQNGKSDLVKNRHGR